MRVGIVEKGVESIVAVAVVDSVDQTPDWYLDFYVRHLQRSSIKELWDELDALVVFDKMCVLYHLKDTEMDHSIESTFYLKKVEFHRTKYFSIYRLDDGSVVGEFHNVVLK